MCTDPCSVPVECERGHILEKKGKVIANQVALVGRGTCHKLNV
jgi:hypothetical protein